MKIGLNEQVVEVPERSTLMEVRSLYRPAADVWILNGAMVMEDAILSEGDEVMLIERGVVPLRDELEAVMAARHTPGVHAQMKAASVGIAGLGGLGSAVAGA